MKLMFYMILMLASSIAIVAGENYSHKYDTFEISFSTPRQMTADVQWGTEKAGMKILVNLSTGENPFIFRHILTTWNSRAATRANLENLWGSYASGNGHTTPTISKLDNGDFLVTGRMMVLNSMFTRAMRTFDFNGDGRLDYIVFWNGNGNFDYDLLNYLASTTNVILIQSWAARTSGHPDWMGREPSRAKRRLPAMLHGRDEPA